MADMEYMVYLDLVLFWSNHQLRSV
jgi:hypothetical protein